jgi:hypothetical protein
MTDKIPRIGSKAMVYHSHALMTSGGLKKSNLMKTKDGRIVSKKKHAQGKKSIKRLFALGYKPTKGTFKLFRKSDAKKTAKKHGKRHTRRRGGAAGVPSGASGTGHLPGTKL